MVAWRSSSSTLFSNEARQPPVPATPALEELLTWRIISDDTKAQASADVGPRPSPPARALATGDVRFAKSVVEFFEDIIWIFGKLPSLLGGARPATGFFSSSALFCVAAKRSRVARARTGRGPLTHFPPLAAVHPYQSVLVT